MDQATPFYGSEGEMQFSDVIAHLDSGALIDSSDRGFAGRCLLALHRHAKHLEELAPEELTQLMLDVKRAARAIRKLIDAARIDHAVLGSAARHSKVHFIPRGVAAICAEPIRLGVRPFPRSRPPMTKPREFEWEARRPSTR